MTYCIVSTTAGHSRESVEGNQGILLRQLAPLRSPRRPEMCVHRCSLVRECLRYYTVLHLALPRASVKDIAYNGIRIPKGTVVYLNALACNMGMLTLFSDSQMSAMWLINLFKDDKV